MAPPVKARYWLSSLALPARFTALPLRSVWMCLWAGVVVGPLLRCGIVCWLVSHKHTELLEGAVSIYTPQRAAGEVSVCLLAA